MRLWGEACGVFQSGPWMTRQLMRPTTRRIRGEATRRLGPCVAGGRGGQRGEACRNQLTQWEAQDRVGGRESA
eukprot:2032896-Rhodomonas_salina.2